MALSLSSTISRSSRTRLSISLLFLQSFQTLRGSAIMSLTFLRGSREDAGSWKTICILLRYGLKAVSESLEISFPSKLISP